MTAHRVLVADPPWHFRDKLPGKGRGASKHYSTLRLHEIQRFALPRLAEDAILFLWRVSALPEEALAVVRAWGFTPKSELVWVKTSKKGRFDKLVRAAGPNPSDPVPRIAIGMGHYVRGSHETCLIATRGRVKVQDRGVPSVFFAPRGEHSAKPEEFYALVERLMPGPYAELFARRRRPGWTQFGDELEPEKAGA